MLLKDKNAIIYGAGGAVGGAVAPRPRSAANVTGTRDHPSSHF
jgi:hypothetical protein